MNEKIQWYKEVLEIEPQARLFFPLAGMLADEGALDEACAVLAKGLTCHPGYMEARMLHVELLHRLGRHDEAAREVQVLHRGLAGRAGFWQAWAGQKAMADEDLAMRCMALFLRGAPVSFADILRRGLDSLEAEYGPGCVARTPVSRPEPAAAADPAAQPAPAAEQADSATAAAAPGMQLRPAAGTATLLAAWAAAPEPATGVAPAGAPEVRDAGSETVSESAAEAEAEPEVVSMPGAASAARGEAAPAVEAIASAAGPAVGSVAADTAASAPAAPADAAAEEDDDDFVEDDGAWPPRTRSMAEVFVDQQEYGDAIHIYKDLLARARDEKERADLGSRLEEIEAMAARPGTTGQADAADEGPRVVDAADDALTVDAGSGAADGELLSMLETLAARVEARAH